MSEWKRSIITYIDLIGTKDAATYPDSRATDLMRQMHTLVDTTMSHNMPNHNCCYAWTDSVLLLAYLDNPHHVSDHDSILQEADSLKKKIDAICLSRGISVQSYAISVQGKVFPDDEPLSGLNVRITQQLKFVRLKTSSYAMGNCFIIERRLGKKLKKPWYIDSRIAKHLSTNKIPSKHSIKMLPRNENRDVYVYDDYLW